MSNFFFGEVFVCDIHLGFELHAVTNFTYLGNHILTILELRSNYPNFKLDILDLEKYIKICIEILTIGS